MVERNCWNCGREISAGKRFCGICGRPVPANAESAPPEPGGRFCVKCGAAYVPGKRFCRQCGHAFGAAEPTAPREPSAIAQGESAARESSVRVLESDHANSPSEILPGPSSKAEPGSGPDENVKRASQETPNVSSDGEDSHPLFKFSGDEQEPPSLLPLQADFAAHDLDIKSLGRYGLDDRDVGMFRGLRKSSARRRRTFLLVLGTVCAATVLGAVWVVATYYHGGHRPVQVITQPTSPVAVTRFSTDQPSKPAPQTAPETPITPAKPAAPRQEAGGHEVPAHRAAPKPDTANSYPTSTRSQGSDCTLDANMLSRMLDQADRNREQGNYSDAARQYRSVLNCDASNARAHSGLELTLLDIQHQ